MTETLQGKRVAILADASVGAYDALLLPGGTVNPDQLRADKNLITSRSPEDLPAFSEAIVSQLAGTTTKEEETS
ncbi:hypothetical protein [Nesterenkonia massiliensis]|uniref:hypothetical protein n=1 Tax=Nesterenkonia massiliensis TaxID=1232429 RepID=UPI0030B7FF06